MVRRRSTTPEQVASLLILYAENVPIKEIMRRTGIKSEQTLYSVLDDNNIKRKPKKRCPLKQCVSFEDDVEMDVLEHKANVSAFVCECIRKAREYDKLVACNAISNKTEVAQ